MGPAWKGILWKNVMEKNACVKENFVVFDIPEYKQSSPCTLHTEGSAGVLAAGGANLLLYHPRLPQGMCQHCSAGGNGIQMSTSHKTGPIGRPGRTCTLSRNLSGTVPGTGRISPRIELWKK